MLLYSEMEYEASEFTFTSNLGTFDAGEHVLSACITSAFKHCRYDRLSATVGDCRPAIIRERVACKPAL